MPNNEPLIWTNVTSAIMAVLGALVALGVIDLLPEQMQAIEGAIAAVLLVVGPGLLTWWGRRQSVPLNRLPLEVQRSLKR